MMYFEIYNFLAFNIQSVIYQYLFPKSIQMNKNLQLKKNNWSPIKELINWSVC